MNRADPAVAIAAGIKRLGDQLAARHAEQQVIEPPKKAKK